MVRKAKSTNSLVVGSLTDTGRSRTNNEDSYVVLLPPNVPSGVDAILAVADGMGGHQAGEVASELAMKTISRGLGRRGNTSARKKGFPEGLKTVAEEANRLIKSAGHGEHQGMGTTLTLVAIQGNRLQFAHVGDSRAYLLRKEELRQITQDHSWVGEELRAGRITPEEAETHPRRNLLTRALGTEESVSVDTDSLKLDEGDLLLLCSDGLHGVVSDDQIRASLMDKKDPQAACDELVRLANKLGGPDNVTVVVARVGRVLDSSNAKTIPSMRASKGQRTRRWSSKVVWGVGIGGALVSVVVWLVLSL